MVARCATPGRSQDVCRRNPGYPSKANVAKLVVDHFLRGLRLTKKRRREMVGPMDERRGQRELRTEGV